MRNLKVKVKSAKGRTTSSTRWLQRQLNDPFVKEARLQGFRSRSAFKLMEIDNKFSLLKKGYRVLDLGCAPGGWCQIAAKKVGVKPSENLVTGLDLKQCEAIVGVKFVEIDFLDEIQFLEFENSLDTKFNVIPLIWLQILQVIKKPTTFRLWHLLRPRQTLL